MIGKRHSFFRKIVQIHSSAQQRVIALMEDSGKPAVALAQAKVIFRKRQEVSRDREEEAAGF